MAAPPPDPRERWFDVSLFWRDSSLWPVAICGVGIISAMGAGAVSMALSRNPFARAALGLAALMTGFALFERRRATGRFGAGLTIAALLWSLSIAGGFGLAALGD
jgi:hypothetical protein